jgi:predicted DNA-binding transcriptional regulator YafY
MNKAEFKSEGLDALRLYLLAQPGGGSLRQAELARHFAVNKSTIGRWIASLEANGVPILWDEQKRVAIDRKRYFTHLSLSRYESIVLMLALRLYQQRQHKSDRNAVEMLQKLGVALHQGVAPTAGEHILAIAHHQRLQEHERHSEQQRVLEALGDAWLDGRKVQMRYRPLRARRAFDDVFHPYLLEPSAISRSTYVIGYSELNAALRVRKLERIERTPVVLTETFTIAESFDPFKLLGGAWSIWFDADASPVTVQLRFHGEEVVRRVLEERWHPSEHKERDSDGCLLWTAEIDEPQEMLPWIRGWGAACEVVGPAELRDKALGELRRQLRMYGVVDSESTDRRQRFDDIFG